MPEPIAQYASSPSKKKSFRNIIIVISVIIVLLIVVIAALYLVMINSNKNNQPTAQNTNQNQQPQVTTGPTLAPGQTNPNVVGFGQTFECNPRTDEEFYRTDSTFVIDPKDPMVMYINAEYLGFHKSIDGGKTWKLLTNGIKAYGRNDDPNTPCYSEYPVAVIDPTNSKRIILVVSGAGGTPKDVNALSSGILESLDGGESFKQIINDDMNGYVSSFTLDTVDPKIIYYGSNSSPASYLEADPNKIFVKTGLVYKFDNTWSELPTSFNPYTGATGVHVNPKNNKEIVVFTMSAPKPQGGQRSVEGATQMGVLRSTDAGKTWNPTHPLPSNYEAVILHRVSDTNFNNMFVTPFTQGGASPKSFYSTDAGLTFKESSRYIDFIAYDPNDKAGNRLLGFAWQGMNGPTVNKLFESLDAGATWHEFVNLPKEIVNVGDKKTFISNIVWDPVDVNTFYMTGAGAHIWKTTDNGQTWTVLLDYTMLTKL